MSHALIDYFNKQPRLGCLSTADREGRVDVAYFGSPRMTDEKTIVMGTGRNRTYKNLQENPHGVFIVMEPGKTIMDWKGVRLYVKMVHSETEGENIQRFKADMAKVVGEGAARMIYAYVVFEIYETRPVADFGQGWEKSIGS